MEKRDRDGYAGRMIYIVLTAMAVIILCVTLFTFFGAQNRDVDDRNETDSMTDKPAETRKLPGPTTSQDDKKSPGTSSTGNEKMKNIDEVPDDSVTSDIDTKDSVQITPSDDPAKESVAAEASVTPLGERKLLPPVEGIVTHKHDLTTAVYSITMNDYRVHCGIDICANAGDNVIACCDGTVIDVVNDPFMGMSVTIDFGGGLIGCYRNLSLQLADNIEKDANVKSGQVIGSVGETAALEIAQYPHLHFELTYNGSKIDPLSVINIPEADQASLYLE